MGSERRKRIRQAAWKVLRAILTLGILPAVERRVRKKGAKNTANVIGAANDALKNNGE